MLDERSRHHASVEYGEKKYIVHSAMGVRKGARRYYLPKNMSPNDVTRFAKRTDLIECQCGDTLVDKDTGRATKLLLDCCIRALLRHGELEFLKIDPSLQGWHLEKV